MPKNPKITMATYKKEKIVRIANGPVDKLRKHNYRDWKEAYLKKLRVHRPLINEKKSDIYIATPPRRAPY